MSVQSVDGGIAPPGSGEMARKLLRNQGSLEDHVRLIHGRILCQVIAKCLSLADTYLPVQGCGLLKDGCDRCVKAMCLGIGMKLTSGRYIVKRNRFNC